MGKGSDVLVPIPHFELACGEFLWQIEDEYDHQWTFIKADRAYAQTLTRLVLDGIFASLFPSFPNNISNSTSTRECASLLTPTILAHVYSRAFDRNSNDHSTFAQTSLTRVVLSSLYLSVFSRTNSCVRTR